MKNMRLIFSIVLLMFVAAGCSKEEGIDDDLSFLNTVNSGNLNAAFLISNDNTGIVKITPTGEGVSTFNINFGDGTGGVSSENVLPGYSASHAYPEGNYTVTVTGYDLAGKSTVKTFPLTLVYRVPENLQISVNSDMRVSATADYANSFLVYYGDVPNEVGTPLAVGATLPPHIYAPGGPYTLRVVALSGGLARTEKTKTLFGFPLTFEHPTMDYFFGTFGNVQFDKVANPFVGGLNTSATVGRYTKPVGAESWSGTYSPMDIPINMAHGMKLKVLVYNPNPANVGKMLNVELEANVDGTPNGIPILKMPLTTSGAWEELTFDFSTIPAVGANARFNQLVLRFNDNAGGNGEVIYVDNFRLTN